LKEEKIIENENYVRPKKEKEYNCINFIEKCRELDELLKEIDT
jgi:hypothetical protein